MCPAKKTKSHFCQFKLSMSFVSYLILFICISICPSTFASLEHSDFHRAIFLGIRLPQSFEKQLITELGLISCLVVSGIHFQIALGLSKKLKVPSSLLSPFSLALAFLWSWNLPVMRAFLEFQFKNSKTLQRAVANPFLTQAICFFICLFRVNSSYDLHSLWLSFIFSFYFQSANLSNWPNKVLSGIFIFCITPFLLPFPSKLSVVSILLQIFFLSLFTIFLFISPLLHLHSEQTCQMAFKSLLDLFRELTKLFPYHHPFQSGGYNLCLLFFFLMILFAKFRSQKLRKKFFKHQSSSFH